MPSLLERLPAEARRELSAALASGRLTAAEVGGVGREALESVFAVATRLLAAGEASAALDVCGLLVLLDARDVRFLTLTGSCLTALDRWESAADTFGIAVGVDPDDVRARLCRGEALVRIGRTDQGLEMLEEVLETAPSGELEDLLDRARQIVEAHRHEVT